MMKLLGAALCAIIYVSGAAPVPIDVPALVQHQVATVKPAKPKKPRNDDDCIPIGVVKHPNGMVLGVEDCDGEKVYTRMGTS
jgi:hypothetical protein